MRMILECKYGKEPLDTRLCFLRLLKKIWLLPLMAVVGAVLFGMIYFLVNAVYAPAREYTAESEFYIEYKDAITLEQQYTYYNKETWETLIHSDVFLDTLKAAAADFGQELSRETLKTFVSATLLTDVRVVHAKVITNSPELTMVLSDALIPAFVEFGQQQREVDEIRVITTPETAVMTPVDARMVQACLLGVIVFVAFTLFFMYLYAVLDTSFYIPLEFERRFGIPMVADYDLEGCTVIEESVLAEKQQDGTYVLYVKSKNHNRALVEKTIRELLGEEKTIVKAVLMNADKKLIQWYFKTKFI